LYIHSIVNLTKPSLKITVPSLH